MNQDLFALAATYRLALPTKEGFLLFLHEVMEFVACSMVGTPKEIADFKAEMITLMDKWEKEPQEPQR